MVAVVVYLLIRVVEYNVRTYKLFGVGKHMLSLDLVPSLKRVTGLDHRAMGSFGHRPSGPPCALPLVSARRLTRDPAGPHTARRARS